ncbi:MAG: tetratricopeptide repeat protein [Maribacter sp.]|nr:tetratricopeptide repeat protein [Maribacter sp.]
MKQHIKKYWLITSIFILSLTLFSCKKDTVKINGDSSNAQLDSISLWVAAAKNEGNELVDQKLNIEKAYSATNALGNDSIKTKQLSQVSLAYLRLSDSLMFRKVNSETLQLARKTNDSVTLAETHWDLGTFFQNRAIADSAYHHFAEAQRMYSAQHNQFYSGRMLYNMARVQSSVKDYTGSEINTIKAIELLKPLNKNTQLFNCYNLLGIVTKNLKEYDRALKYYNLAWGYLNKLEDKQDYEIQVLNNIGVVYQEQEQHQQAISYFEQVLGTDGLKKLDADLYAISLNNLAYNRLKSGIIEGVEKQVHEALFVRDSIGDIAGISRSHHVLAELYLQKKDTAIALNELLMAKDYAEQSTHNEYLLNTLQLLSRIDTKNSFSHTQQYINLSDSLLQEERQARNKFTRIRFETDEFIAENEVLTRKKQIWTGVAIGLFLLGALVYIIVDQRAKNQKLKFQQKQQASNQEIFNLMLSQKEKLEEGKQMEQKRISEELHDGVLGKMLGARMVLTGLNKKTDEEAARERAIAISALKDIEGEVRSISHELSHAAYQKIHNFISSIQELLKDVCSANTIEYDFTYTEELDWDALDGEIKINLYRIIQESTQNSVKHAECKNISVDFNTESDYLNVRIEDDGKGFTRSKRKKGIGTRNISSRIEKLRGTWKIDSTPGQGTKVMLSIPIVYYTEDLPQNENAKLIES